METVDLDLTLTVGRVVHLWYLPFVSDRKGGPAYRRQTIMKTIFGLLAIMWLLAFATGHEVLGALWHFVFDGGFMVVLTVAANIAFYALIFAVVLMVGGLALGLLDVLPERWRLKRPGRRRDLSGNGTWVEGADIDHVGPEPAVEGTRRPRVPARGGAG